MNRQEFKNLLDEQVLIIDGAMGTMTQNLGFGPEIYGGEEFQMLSDILVLSRPDAIKDIHLQYYRSGASAVETNTLCSSPLRLEEHDFTKLDDTEFAKMPDGRSIKELSLDEICYQLNKQSVEAARAAIEEHKQDPSYDQRQLLVLGSIGPSNWVLSSTQADLKKGDFDTIKQNFYQQALGLIDGGVDVFLFETQQDILELKCGILGVKEAVRDRGVDIPIMAQVTVDAHARMQIFNTDIVAAYTTLYKLGIDCFGINCGLGPDQLLPAIKKLSEYSELPFSIIPNAGLPESINGQTVFSMTPEKMAEHMKGFVEEYGINIIGGCCGTTPAHIQKLREVIGFRKPTARSPHRTALISGPQEAISLDSKESLIRIGERLNVRGSKKVRDAVEQDGKIDHEALEEVISEQTRDLGLEIIDVCMDSNIVNTRDTIVEVIQQQTFDFSGAMSLDSFDVSALEAAIKVYPGRPIINSISLEEFEPGVDKIDAVLERTKAHAPVYIALTTDLEGPAITAEKKIELAQKIVTKAKEKHGVTPDQLIIDINAFPIGSESTDNMNFAMESLNSIPEIKKIHPDLKVTIGVGNLTNGLAKKPYMRKVLTSVFLDEGRKNGLDAAIVNPNHYVPVDSLPESDYAIGLKIIKERDLDAFAELEEIALQKKGTVVKKKLNYDDLETIPAICAKIKGGYKERQEGSVTIDDFTYQYLDRIVEQAAEAIQTVEPLKMVNDHLMPAMEDLGTEFAAGTVSLPHLLKSADVMKQVMGFLESYLKHKTGLDASATTESKGTIVLGTVYQDVHSIGKDLTKTLMENYGYHVVDLGVQVPVRDFIDTAKKHKAIAIGMSALLVQTSNHMITVSSMLEEEDMADIPILIGGAPVNKRHAAFVALAGKEDVNTMRSNVFYCRSGMDGVNILSNLGNPEQRNKLETENRKALMEAYQSGIRLDKEREELLKTLPMRTITFPDRFETSEKLGEIQKIESNVVDFLPHINQKLLFSLNWKYGGKGSWAKKGVTEEELVNKMEEWARKSQDEGWLAPKAVYAMFPCKGSRDHVIVLDPQSKEEIARLSFNDVIGQGKKDIFNIAQFFHPDREDLLALQVCTGGADVSSAITQLKENDREGALLLQGLSDRLAEDMAEYTNRLIETRVYTNSDYSSKRYSPGYPAMTDITNNRAIAELVEATDRLGIKLTGGAEFSPTGTTAAVICFHQEADYH